MKAGNGRTVKPDLEARPPFRERPHGTSPRTAAGEESPKMDQLFDRTLFVTRYVPLPSRTGALQYTLQLIRLFSALSGSVDVLCQARPGDAAATIEPETHGIKGTRFLVQPGQTTPPAAKIASGLPHAALAHDSDQNRRRLDELLQQRPDCIVIDHIGSAWAQPAVAAYKARHHDVTVTYCTHNFERDLRLAFARSAWRNPKLALGAVYDALRIDRSDRKLNTLADLVTFISTFDRDKFVARYGPDRTLFIRPTYADTVCRSRQLDQSVPRRVCLLGSFLWSAKKANLQAFLAQGHATFSDHGIELVVVGWMDDAFLQRMRKRWPDVTFTGPVDQVEPYLANCRIGVTPEAVGGGFKLKNLSYVFNRVPVFALVGSVTDTPLEPGASMDVFKDMASLCRGIVDRIDDVERLNAMQNAAFAACSGFLDDRQVEAELRAALQGQRQSHPQPTAQETVSAR